VLTDGIMGGVPDAADTSDDVRDVAPDETVAVDAATPRRRRRIDKGLLTVSAVAGLGLALVVRGLFLGVTGDDRAPLPPQIERLNPVPEATQVLSQSNVFVDLAAGHTGVLIIDGIELETINVAELSSDRLEPGQQVRIPAVTVFEPGNATLTFTPGSDAPISEFVDGEHRATVVYWRADESRRFARTFSWTFTVV
jgi:hypothetical protein